MIDITMTACIRPDIFERTLKSIGENIDYRPLRLIVDVAPIGITNKYSSEYMVEFIQSICNKYDIQVTTRALAVSWQSEALRWTWKEAITPYVLQWEDDWVLRQKLDLYMLVDLMQKHYNIGMIYFDRYQKSVLTHKQYKGFFINSKSAYNDNIYIRIKDKTLGGPPALLSREYMRQVIPIIKDNECLDITSESKKAQELLKSWILCVYTGDGNKGNLVEDIGKEWLANHNFKRIKRTDKGVQWIKN